MPNNCQNSMTTYECIATIIAIIALIQPWVIALWKKFFKPLKIFFFPSAKIKLYYNRSGAYIYLGGVIEAKNRPAIIKDISVKIIRKIDKAELQLDWSSFILPVFQSVGGSPVTANEIARPFLIGANQLNPIFVEFEDENTQFTDRLQQIHKELQMKSNQIYEELQMNSNQMMNIHGSFEQAVSKLKDTPEYKNFREELLGQFYWQESEYRVEMSIKYNDNLKNIYKYRFSINSEEYSLLKNNIEHSMLIGLYQQYFQAYNFCVLQKDFISAEE